jgi:hypothetical protein
MAQEEGRIDHSVAVLKKAGVGLDSKHQEEAIQQTKESLYMVT